MYKFLRMTCAILAAAGAVASIFLAIYFGMVAFMGCLAGTLLLFAFCLFFKFMQEEADNKKMPSSVGDAEGKKSSREEIPEPDPTDRAADTGRRSEEPPLPDDRPSGDKRG